MKCVLTMKTAGSVNDLFYFKNVSKQTLREWHLDIFFLFKNSEDMCIHFGVLTLLRICSLYFEQCCL